MKPLSYRLMGLSAAAAAFLAHQPSRANISLTGLLAYSADSTGSLAGYPGAQQVWNTDPFFVTADMWVSTSGFNGPFINGPDDSQVSINVPLSPGLHTFYLRASSVPPYDRYGLNLFFDGDALAPGITAVTPLTLDPGDLGNSFAVVPNSATTVRLDGEALVPAAGTLLYTAGNHSVLLKDFAWFDASVRNSDQVGFYFIAPDGSPDFEGRFTLEVVNLRATPTNGAIPEPATAVGGVLLAGVVGGTAWRRCAARKAA